MLDIVIETLSLGDQYRMGSIQINNSVGSMMIVLYEGHTQYSNKDEIVWLESEYSLYLLWLDLIWGRRSVRFE